MRRPQRDLAKVRHGGLCGVQVNRCRGMSSILCAGCPMILGSSLRWTGQDLGVLEVQGGRGVLDVHEVLGCAERHLTMAAE
jgi:hypothetical protein